MGDIGVILWILVGVQNRLLLEGYLWNLSDDREILYFLTINVI